MQTFFNDIPPARALGIEITGWENGRIQLCAPLEKNLNDKGTAFAGSIDSLLNLAGWSAITLALRDAGVAADVMILKSETEYVSAVRADLTATAELGDDEKARLLKELAASGRSRSTLECRLLSAGSICAGMTAQYAVRMRSGMDAKGAR